MDIVKLVSQFATPAVLDQIAVLLGVSQGAAQKGLGAAIPGVLAGLLGASKRPGTTDALGSALSGAGGLGDLLGSDPAAAASKGSDLLSSLLGGEATGALTSALGSYAGMPKAGAGSLLGLAGSMALGALGKEASSKGLDAGGVLGLLDASKDEITGALPTDFAQALGAAGLLPAAKPAVAAPRAAPAAVRTPPPPPPPAKKSGWTKWLLWLVALAILLWLLTRLFAPEPEPIVETAPPAETTAAPSAPEPTPEPAPAAEPAAPATAPATEPAEPAPSDTAATPASPLVVGGADIGASVSGALESITSTFTGITDPASAQAALPRLTEARDTLSGLEGTVSALPEAGRSALKEMVSAALPAIRTAAERLKTDGPIAAVVAPVVDDILARLTAFAA